MLELYLRAAVAGALFSIWPIFMKRSGLSGHVASLGYGLSSLACIIPVVLATSGFKVPQADWSMVFLSGAVGALGLLCFTGMYEKATLENFGTLLIVANLFQVAGAAVYQSYVTNSLSPQRLGGFLFGAIAIYLMGR